MSEAPTRVSSPVHFGSRRGYWLLLTLASAAMAAGGGFIIAVDGVRSILGWSGLLFFGGCALVGVAQASRRGPRLTIDDDGVLDRTLKVGVIAWEDIEDASLIHIQGNPFIALELRDATRYTAQLSPVMQRLVRANVALGYPPLSLNLTGLDADPDQVAELLMKEWLLRHQGAAT